MISIIIPLYNKEAIIERTLQSVLSQDYDDFEVVVVDDGSTDKSAGIVRKIDDPRVHFIEQENGGPSKARNTGIKHSKGEWLYFLDADDEMLPGTLSHFNGLTTEYPEADMFLGEICFFDGKHKSMGKKYKEGFVDNIFKSHFLGVTLQCSGSSLYKKSVCEKFMYNEQIRRYEDLECLFNRYRKCSLYLTHHPVAIVNVDFAAASKARKDIIEDFVGHLDFKGKSFWERMCLYQLFLWERDNYPEQCKKLYPFLYKRLDYYILYQLLTRTRLLWV